MGKNNHRDDEVRECVRQMVIDSHSYTSIVQETGLTYRQVYDVVRHFRDNGQLPAHSKSITLVGSVRTGKTFKHEIKNPYAYDWGWS